MASIDLGKVDIILSDGAGNHLMFLNNIPPKMPRTKHQRDKWRERWERVGGQCRSWRLKKKRRTAMKRAWYFGGPFEGQFDYSEEPTSRST